MSYYILHHFRGKFHLSYFSSLKDNHCFKREGDGIGRGGGGGSEQKVFKISSEFLGTFFTKDRTAYEATIFNIQVPLVQNYTK